MWSIANYSCAGAWKSLWLDKWEERKHSKRQVDQGGERVNIWFGKTRNKLSKFSCSAIMFQEGEPVSSVEGRGLAELTLLMINWGVAAALSVFQQQAEIELRFLVWGHLKSRNQASTAHCNSLLIQVGQLGKGCLSWEKEGGPSGQQELVPSSESESQTSAEFIQLQISCAALQ